MAIATKQTGQRVQAWVPPDLARQLKAHADSERRSVSQVVRLAIEDQLRAKGRRAR
jgi:CopG-like RHH_1 or ribbon-helix-helix domain, RHH_5